MKQKCSVQINPLSCKQLVIRSKAAAILEAFSYDVPLALEWLHSSTRNSSTSPGKVKLQTRRLTRRRAKLSSFDMAQRSSSEKMESSERAVPLPRSTDVLTFAGNSWLSNYFGFDMILPQQWSDCFASLVPGSRSMLDSGAGSKPNPLESTFLRIS